MADINDVYAWMATDAAKINLALTVSPADPGTRSFGPSVTYAFHLTSRPGFAMAGMESKVICKFASNTDGECWLINPAGTTVDYVKGDFSAAAGVTSESGKLRAFAGRRSDPFFFNLGGVHRAIGYAQNVCAGGDGTGSTRASCPPPVSGATDAAGCMQVTASSAATIRALIGAQSGSDLPSTPICNETANIDCFINLNVMAIVLQVDPAAVNVGTNKLLSVWASTHTGS